MSKLTDIIKTVQKFATVQAVNEPEREQIQNMQKAVQILEALEEYEIFAERLDITTAVWAYYITSQNTGHFDLLRQGVDNYDKPFMVVIGADSQREQYLGCKTVHYSKIADVAGVGHPLAWDEKALIRLMSSFSMIQSAFSKIKNTIEN